MKYYRRWQNQPPKFHTNMLQRLRLSPTFPYYLHLDNQEYNIEPERTGNIQQNAIINHPNIK